MTVATALTDREARAVEVFKDVYAGDDVELDEPHNGEYPKPHVSDADGGVWVRCWQWISDDQLEAD